MKNFYLIGENLNNSLSPYIHNYVFNILGIKAKYKIKAINFKSDIPIILTNLSKGDIQGINITNPYKVKIFHQILSCDSVAQKIGSINCISREDNHPKGFNTDWLGFMKTIKGITINNVKIIGYGGAGKAVEYALLSLGIKNIQIYTRKKINHSNNIVYKNINEIFNNNQKKGLIVNATPYHFINENNIDNFLNLSSEKMLWIDLLYTKLSTKKELFFNEKLYKNGLDMLIYQAFESLNIWFRKDITKDVDFDDLKSYLERKNNVI